MHFLSRSSKKEKNSPGKKFFIFQEMELYSPNIKKLLIFSYISGNKNSSKIPYISGNGRREKLHICQ